MYVYRISYVYVNSVIKDMLHLPLEQDRPVGRVKFIGWTQQL